MQFLYHIKAGHTILDLKGDEYKYIFKVRRYKTDDIVAIRDLQSKNIYYYKIKSIDKKSAVLILQRVEYLPIEAKKRLHIGWCIIEPKNIEKMLPSLNELGVDKITFIYCSRSQKNFKIDFNRLNRILINSSQQCGRSSIIKLDIIESLKEFISINPNSYILNFSNKYISNSQKIDTIIIGCEGGFSRDELDIVNKDKIIGFDTRLILKSETATTTIASKLLI